MKLINLSFVKSMNRMVATPYFLRKKRARQGELPTELFIGRRNDPEGNANLADFLSTDIFDVERAIRVSDNNYAVFLGPVIRK